MIKLQVNSRDLDLPPGLKIRLDFLFPFPDRETIPAPKVYWFDILLTANNVKALSWPQFTISKRVKTYPCKFWVGAWCMAGILVSKELSHEKIRACISLNPFTDPEIKDKDISSFDYGPDIITGADQDETLAFLNNAIQNDTQDFALPMVLNAKFFGDDKEANPDFYSWVNNYDPVSGLMKNTMDQNPAPDNINVIVPYFKLVKIIDKLFRGLNFEAAGGFMDDPDIQKLIVHNNYAASYKENKWHSLASSSIGYVQTIDYGKLNILNIIEDNDNCYNQNIIYRSSYQIKEPGYYSIRVKLDARNIDDSLDGTPYLKIYATFIEYSTLHYFMRQSEDLLVGEYNQWVPFEYTFHYWVTQERIDDGYCIETWVDSFTIIDGPHIRQDAEFKDVEFEITNVSWRNMDHFAREISINDHLPKVTFSGFLNELAKLFTLSIFINTDTKQIEFEWLDDIIKSQNYLDLTKWFIAGSEMIQVNQDEGFYFDMDFSQDGLAEDNFKTIDEYSNAGDYNNRDSFPVIEDLNIIVLNKAANLYHITSIEEDMDLNDYFSWRAFTDNFYKAGNGAKELKTKVSTLFMRNNGFNKVFPKIEQKGTSKDYDTGMNEPGFKLLFYHGLTADSDGDIYPFASSMRYGWQGEELAGFSLKWNGGDGLYETKGKRYYEYIQNRDKVKMKFNIGLLGFYQITRLMQPQQTLSKTRKIRVGNKNYIPDEFHFVISMDGIEECEGVLI